MPVLWIVLIDVLLAATGFAAGRWRALSAAGGDTRRLHSRPHYYGWNAALFAALPALLLLVLWLIAQPLVIDRSVARLIPTATADRPLMLEQVQRLTDDLRQVADSGALTAEQLATDDAALQAAGVDLPSDPAIVAAARADLHLHDLSRRLMSGAVLLLAAAGLAFALARTRRISAPATSSNWSSGQR